MVDESTRCEDEMAIKGQGDGVRSEWGQEIRTLLERQPLNPFKRMEFSVLSFRHPEGVPVRHVALDFVKPEGVS